jgi:hypothetical protein
MLVRLVFSLFATSVVLMGIGAALKDVNQTLFILVSVASFLSLCAGLLLVGPGIASK